MGQCQSRGEVQVAVKATGNVRGISSASLALEESESTVAVTNKQDGISEEALQEEDDEEDENEDTPVRPPDSRIEPRDPSAYKKDPIGLAPPSPRGSPRSMSSSIQDSDLIPSVLPKNAPPSPRGSPRSKLSSIQDSDLIPSVLPKKAPPSPGGSPRSKLSSIQGSDLITSVQTKKNPPSPRGSPRLMLSSIKGSDLIPSVLPKKNSSNKRPPKRKTPTFGLSFTRSTIPEEEDPEMPSDEEDFREQLVRNTPRDEPGRLVPIKLRTQATASVSSVGVAGRSDGHSIVRLNSEQGNNAVHLQTLSEFQRLKLQVKLQKHQEMKGRKVHKIEDRVQDAETYKKLWLEYKKTEEDLARIEGIQPDNGTDDAIRRTDSFDLKDSGSWFFDFQSVDTTSATGVAKEEEEESQASLSLLSEQSLDAQRRYYAQKRRQRKEQKKMKKIEKEQQKYQGINLGSATIETANNLSVIQPSGQPAVFLLDAAVVTPDALSRLNPVTSSTASASGATRDYGPVRENHYRVHPGTPLDVEVSFQNRPSPTDDAGSYVSDLGDESLTGSLSGLLHHHTGHTPLRSNDYGVKRRIRLGGHSGYSNKDHELLQAKLKSLEKSLELMRQQGDDAAEPQVSTTEQPNVDGKFADVPLEKLIKKLEEAANNPSPSDEGQATERELALQIQKVILTAGSTTKKTRKESNKKKSLKPTKDGNNGEKSSGVKIPVSSEALPTAVLSHESRTTFDQVVPFQNAERVPSADNNQANLGNSENLVNDFKESPQSPYPQGIMDALTVIPSPQDAICRRQLFPTAENPGKEKEQPSDLLATTEELESRDDANSSVSTGPCELGSCSLQVMASSCEEKKTDENEEQRLVSDDDTSISRATPGHDPIFASMTKDEFFRIAHTNPVTDRTVLQRDLDKNNNVQANNNSVRDTMPGTSVGAGHKEDPPSISTFWTEELNDILLKNIIPERAIAIDETKDIVVTPDTPSTTSRERFELGYLFWTEELDKILLKNIIPERTNLVPDCKESTPATVMCMTPDTPPTGMVPIDTLASDDEDESLDWGMRHLPDPEGRRIDSGERIDAV